MDISYKTGAASFYEALGISEERANELEFKFKLALHDYLRPTEDECLPPQDQILRAFIAFAQNQQELIYCSYFAGMKTEEILGDALIIEEGNTGN